MVVARVHGPPFAIEINLEPGAEIHGSARWRNANVSQIAGGVASGDIHAAAKRDGQMLVIAAHSGAFGIDVERGLGGTRVVISELNLAVNPIQNRLYTAPTRLRMAE